MERTLTCTEGCIPHQDAHTEECIKADEQYQAEAWADIDAQIEPLVQGVCKDCGTGTLNNALHEAFIVDEVGQLVCSGCGSTHLDIL